MKLLWIEDDLMENTKTIDLAKNEKDLTVVTVTTGYEALTVIAKHRTKFDGIVFGCDSSNAGGIEFVKVVRNLGFRIPFFILTADAGLSKKTALNAGATELFYKPVILHNLVTAIRKSLSAFHKH